MRRRALALAACVVLCPLALRPGGVPAPPPAPPALWQAPGRPAGIVLASWYGPGFAGRPTASGTPFDPAAFTCASPILPLGARIRVTRLDTRQILALTVTDRGPYVGGRGLDLSQAAAAALGFQRQGLAALAVEVLP